MNSRLITPIILAGGKGTRLWPMSREALPKQFCDIGQEQTLFQSSLSRVDNRLIFNPAIVICNEQHAETATAQANELGVTLSMVVCEPAGRNTAPAIALSVEASKHPSDHLYLVMPSDHAINDKQLFQQTITAARSAAADKYRIVTLGKEPDYAETGFGYIRAGDVLENTTCAEIASYIEKPERKNAEMLVQENDVFWNVGMFFFRGDTLFSELERLTPKMLKEIRSSVRNGIRTGNRFVPEASAFKACENISFDYAVMEKTNRGAITTLKSDWSDMGSWAALWELSGKDTDRNCIKGNVIDVDSEGCMISSDGPFVGTCGLTDIVVVANRDAVLVAPRRNAQGIKNLVSAMRKKNNPVIKAHAGETRPWGSFESLDKGENHQVKRIEVKPGGQLSLQYHFHRSEHWIVVKGTATVTVDTEVCELGPCQQIFIPQGAVHRLENFTDEPVEIVEVQYGDYLGEDDIVRVEDVYDRAVQANSAAEKKVA